VLDADVSSGEKEGGDYLVFVELERTDKLPEQILEIMEDIMNLTEQKIEEWRVRYYRSTTDNELTQESLANIIPLTPEEYSNKYDKEVDSTEPEDITKDLDAMKAVAGVPVTTTAPKNEYTESLRIAAGLK
jgi:Ca2+-binding EF-hand superfamily protein